MLNTKPGMTEAALNRATPTARRFRNEGAPAPHDILCVTGKYEHLGNPAAVHTSAVHEARARAAQGKVPLRDLPAPLSAPTSPTKAGRSVNPRHQAAPSFPSRPNRASRKDRKDAKVPAPHSHGGASTTMMSPHLPPRPRDPMGDSHPPRPPLVPNRRNQQALPTPAPFGTPLATLPTCNRGSTLQ